MSWDLEVPPLLPIDRAWQERRARARAEQASYRFGGVNWPGSGSYEVWTAHPGDVDRGVFPHRTVQEYPGSPDGLIVMNDDGTASLDRGGMGEGLGAFLDRPVGDVSRARVVETEPPRANPFPSATGGGAPLSGGDGPRENERDGERRGVRGDTGGNAGFGLPKLPGWLWLLLAGLAADRLTA